MTLDDVRAALVPYGATLDESGRIVKGKTLGVAVTVKGKRLHVRDAGNGSLLFSGAGTGSVGVFVESYWYWSKS